MGFFNKLKTMFQSNKAENNIETKEETQTQEEV